MKGVNPRVCVCADDYALSPGVSRGILQAVVAGRISATSAMANRRDWPRAAAALKPVAGKIAVGLHLNLTLGAPLTNAPQLAPNGSLPSIKALMRAAPSRAELEAEICAQLDAFGREWGAVPDYVDGHQHVHVIAPVRDALLDALSARGLAGRVWLRDSADHITRILRRGTTLPKALGIAWIARDFAKIAAGRGFDTNDGFSGFSAFDPRQSAADGFARHLRAPGPRQLVMCHPGIVDDELAAVDPVTTTREQELAFLLSDEWPACLARADLTLGPLQSN